MCTVIITIILSGGLVVSRSELVEPVKLSLKSRPHEPLTEQNAGLSLNLPAMPSIFQNFSAAADSNSGFQKTLSYQWQNVRDHVVLFSEKFYDLRDQKILRFGRNEKARRSGRYDPIGNGLQLQCQGTYKSCAMFDDFMAICINKGIDATDPRSIKWDCDFSMTSPGFGTAAYNVTCEPKSGIWPDLLVLQDSCVLLFRPAASDRPRRQLRRLAVGLAALFAALAATAYGCFFYRRRRRVQPTVFLHPQQQPLSQQVLQHGLPRPPLASSGLAGLHIREPPLPTPFHPYSPPPVVQHSPFAQPQVPVTQLPQLPKAPVRADFAETQSPYTTNVQPDAPPYDQERSHGLYARQAAFNPRS